MTRPLLALLLLVACGDDDVSNRGPVTMEPPVRPENLEGALYDAEGNLLPSDEVVAGLTLPRGLEAQGSTDERVHRYWSREVPIGKVVGYFGPVLVTGQVSRVGEGVVYEDAVPRDAEGGVVHLDVGIHPSPRGGARVEIRERPPARRAPLSDAELRELATELQQGD